MREITDRTEEYFVKIAPLIKADPLAHYARAEQGRKVQAAIRPKNFTLVQLIAHATREEDRKRLAKEYPNVTWIGGGK